MKYLQKIGKLNIGFYFALCRILIPKDIKETERKHFIEKMKDPPLKGI